VAALEGAQRIDLRLLLGVARALQRARRRRSFAS
jgi:hypothetical protein